MPIVICPRCNQRVLVEAHSEDVEHICNSTNEVVDNEDVPIVGDWEDYTGSGVEHNALRRGTENTLFGTRGAIEGESNFPRTARGARESTHRTRQHIEHISLENKDGTK